MILVRRPDSCRNRGCTLQAEWTGRPGVARFDHNGSDGVFMVPEHRLLDDLRARDYNAPLLTWLEEQHAQVRVGYRA
jgi:hypothetical protein